jgi:hypothetical protein
VDVSNTALVAVMLAAASAVVRAACQSPVLETTSTVTLWATDDDRYLDLPGKPVTAVSAVSVDGAAVTDHKLVHGRLWRLCGWSWCGTPVEVGVTLTHGFATVPADVKALVVDLAIAGLDAAAEGAHAPNKIAEKIDDYAVTWATGAEAVATAMELPTATRLAFRKRFGGGVALVTAL